MDGRSRGALLATVAAILVAGAAVGVTDLSARSRPTCFGKTATIIGTNHNDRIGGTARKDVIAAQGGDDLIEAKGHKADHGEDIVCGGGGNDKIVGNTDKETLIGGPDNDVITAGNGNDLVVGDNANPRGDESGEAGNDDLAGAGGSGRATTS
jgi:Ca2+-binding RTX toxin-like protein